MLLAFGNERKATYRRRIRMPRYLLFYPGSWVTWFAGIRLIWLCCSERSVEDGRVNTMPRLTIGLPVYNGERYLAESIESLLGQSYRRF